MRKIEDVGISNFSWRKIYHLYAEKEKSWSVHRSICSGSHVFLDKDMTVREAEKKGYRLCLNCQRIMERKK